MKLLLYIKSLPTKVQILPYILQKSDSLANKMNKPWPKHFYPKKLKLLIKLLPDEALVINQTKVQILPYISQKNDRLANSLLSS